MAMARSNSSTTTTTTTTQENASETNPVVLTKKQQQKLLDREMAQAARLALSQSTPFWGGVDWCLDWFRNIIRNALSYQLANLPWVGRWSARIGASVTESVLAVIGTTLGLLKIIFSSSKFWNKAHECAMHAWNSNESNGLLAQIYAYGKKMAAYFLEILRQCLDRSIKANKMELTAAEREEVAHLLDDLLN